MIRLILVLSLFPSIAFADDAILPEQIETRQLAVHMGLSEKDVVFAPPRNFRTEMMNQADLEPLSEEEAERLDQLPSPLFTSLDEE